MTTPTNNAAFEIPCFYVGVLEANVDMSAEATWQFTFVDVGTATGTGLLGLGALVAPAAGAQAFGVLQNNPVLAEAGQVVTLGISKCKASGTFAAGAILKVDTAGKVLAASTGSYGVAKAMQPGVSGQVTSVYVMPYGIQP